LLDQAAKARLPILPCGDVMAIKERRKARKLMRGNKLLGKLAAVPP
jgi:hypothetical protein